MGEGDDDPCFGGSNGQGLGGVKQGGSSAG
jgi:hypothetical protein